MQANGDTVIKVLINLESDKSENGIVSFKELLQEGKDAINSGNREFIDAEIDREKLSTLLFTSGTTGVSKGVMLCHKNIVEDMYVDELDAFIKAARGEGKFPSTLEEDIIVLEILGAAEKSNARK